MKKGFLGKKLLFITAHPDDESYASAGTILANYKAGGESFLITATLGEKGKSHLLKPLSTAGLKKKRKAELMAAVRFLRIKKLFLLGLRDGEVKNHKQTALLKVLPIVKKLKPDYIISFGRDGMSGHLDHIAIGEVARKVARKLRIPFIAFTASPTRVKLMKQLSKTILSRRKHGKYAKKIEYAKANLKIKIDGRAKFKAVSFHKSQLGGRKPSSHFPPKLKNEWLKYEYFRQE